MLGSLNKSYPFNNDLRFNLKTISGISLGIFLFLIFFLPLNPPSNDFNKKILIMAGFAGIFLVLLISLRIIIPSLFPRIFSPQKWTLKREVGLHFLFIVLNSVAFTFFAQYVGRIEITFHLAVNIVLISLTSIIILIIIYEYDYLKKRLKDLLTQNELPETVENDLGIEFKSKNKSENFYLFPEQIILIKAADNYIEIIYKQNDKISRHLVRNSMRETEALTLKYHFLIRCHRSYIVNKNCIQKITKSPEGLKLKLFDYSQEISVSRQYVLKVRESLKQK